MRVTRDKILNFDIASRKEWIATNGIGGFASSTIIGLNTRKYHALLVAALGDTGDRYVVLSKLNESIVKGDKSYTISTNQCGNFVENGYVYQEYFRKALVPEFYYKVDDVDILKKVAMKHGENKVAVSYTIKTRGEDITFRIQPLVNYRKFHDTRNCYELDYNARENAINIRLNSHTTLHMITSEGIFERYDRTYYRNMFYMVEEERGLDAYEDHFMPGAYAVFVPKNTEMTFEFVASVDFSQDFLKTANASEIIRSENTRLEKVCKIAEANTVVEKQLAVAADSFIVDRGNRKTVIAGYPWFGDWGRDTFIAFEGLLLRTNRFKDAKEILLDFSRFIRDGLIPNLIDETGGSAYNTVDASLWYIDAAYKYYKYTHDEIFVQKIYEHLLKIVDAYKNGTRYNICMDVDGLISAGDETTQLTWMDAKVGEIIPTPRFGKCVEINALWYNALNIMSEFSKILGKKFDTDLIEKVKDSYTKFYADYGLFDVIEPTSVKIRPNQIIAIGLEFSPVNEQKAKEILKVVEDELYTDKGLKTLASDDPEYRGYYFGDVYCRDMSYHQGTVWPWLLQPYFEASRKYDGKYKWLENTEELITDDCFGSINEIYDADEPRHPKGAFSQAWSVAMAIINSK
ncbi:MAG: glycogen debranching enzyme family protein [Clostridia bacterium]|nr:glycogen debranching enzyme family protein [Clostridia bacterium]